ncbi:MULTISPECIES: acid-activated periplasmic chaperone HdeB [Serratia]|jgi:acid stress chaperone HdeB|uniref:Acid stress chaperone HdeB n=1 Tax=Serratia fonticola TaxID=47917 RepID=A0AAE7JVS2_SERFO|nr:MULTISPECIES: acid-activated periplasmic chaperone HdeB [Serratia]MBC3216809.1 acid-activated periplasmic chaperone HdeB [Serratia fonticola]MCO7511616.1 acid-activated periplasmic chaperone HdeB [Serratia fonticola]NBJ33270.1 acid-activated periplasmic chaperone HdeB [Serratia fonticola]NCG53618.1 acid-activated periplasmic chaperone HdeB [Serratia fonticola]OCJ45319.1 acid-resistance protein [Serratia sp. 14-2641]
MTKFTKNILIASALIVSSINIANAETTDKTTPQDMTCKEFIDLNPKAMTPVAFWVVNKDNVYQQGDYVDWNEVETIFVPQVIKACKQKPESKLEELKQWFNEVK